jgi:glycosyltransferase involved in cell wall biosynthesis
VVEAMACGTPVVASGAGAIPELLDGGRAGTIVAAGDVEGLRAAVVELLADPARREEMGAAGRALCEERFDAGRQGAEILTRVASLR